MRALLALALASGVSASDVMHVPLLCKYPQASHAAAGAIVGAVVNYAAERHDARFIPRLVASVSLALAAGTVKEYLIDRHARPSEIPAWGLGAAIVSFCWEVRW